MNIEVVSATMLPGVMAWEGDRHYIQLNCSMSRAQIERAIYTLLGQLSTEDAAHMLRSEFPELFTTEESIA